MSTTVSSTQRFTAQHPCPVCGGHPSLHRHNGERCYGFRSSDERYAHCSREEHAGGLPQEDSGTYAHRLDGPCRCGQTHGDAPPAAKVKQNGHARRVVRKASHTLRAPDGTALAVHQRRYFPDGTKDIWWEQPDGTRGLGGMRPDALPLYGIHELPPDAAEVIVTEGEPARDALASLGIPVVATVTGASTTPSADVWDSIEHVQTIYFWPDNDNDGQKHKEKSVARLREIGHRDIRIITWPNARPKADAADFVQRGGTAEDVRALMAGATPATEVHSANSANNPPGASQKNADEWETPVSLDDPPRPPFPVATLPRWLRDYVVATATATQTPVDLAAMLGLGVVGAAVAKKVKVILNTDWEEPVNLYVAVASESGERKTAVYTRMTGPVTSYQAQQRQAQKSEIKAAESRKRIAEARLAQAEKEAAKATTKEDQDTRELLARDAAQELAKISIPASLQLLADDISPEKTVVVLGEQSGRLAIMSDEGGIFDLMAGRYSANGAPNLDVFLKSHVGTDITQDRISREGGIVPNPALSMVLAVQPSVIDGLAAKEGFRGRGLLARFLYSFPVSTVGRRDTKPPPTPAAAKAAYTAQLTKLLEIPMGSDVDEQGDPRPRALTLDGDAEAAFDQVKDLIEPHLRDDGDLGMLKDWGSKLAGAIARIAGLLHMAEHAGKAEPWTTPIDGETMRAAVRIGTAYLWPHAVAAFGRMGADPALSAAKHVLAVIEAWDRPAFTLRDLHQKTRRRVTGAEKLREALRVLEEHGYLIVETADPKSGPGRKKSPLIHVNPRWTPNPHFVDSVYGESVAPPDFASAGDTSPISSMRPESRTQNPQNTQHAHSVDSANGAPGSSPDFAPASGDDPATDESDEFSGIRSEVRSPNPQNRDDEYEEGWV